MDVGEAVLTDAAQPSYLSKPNWKPSSFHCISAPADINTQFALQSVCACVCVRARVCAYVCVCVSI